MRQVPVIPTVILSNLKKDRFHNISKEQISKDITVSIRRIPFTEKNICIKTVLAS
jgi:hypothetical protein